MTTQSIDRSPGRASGFGVRRPGMPLSGQARPGSPQADSDATTPSVPRITFHARCFAADGPPDGSIRQKDSVNFPATPDMTEVPGRSGGALFALTASTE